MNKIYTKTGDTGQTSLLGGVRTNKDCINLLVVGEVDELNAELGIVCNILAGMEPADFLVKIQRDLFKVGAEISAVQNKNILDSLNKITYAQITELENKIDEYWKQLPELKNFILPGGCLASAQLQLSRAICRRAERALVGLGHTAKLRPEIYQYFNRLSDFLFTAARFVNFQNKTKEEIV